MKTNRFRILVGILIVAILGGVAWLTLHPRQSEPTYQGRHLSSWFEQGCWQPASAAAITNMGDRAVPFLIRKLEARYDRYSKLHQILARKLPFNVVRRL